MSLARELAKLLEGSVYEKVNVVEEGVECSVLALRRGDKLHLAALAKHDDWVYVKIAVGDAVPAHAWTCSNIFYTPYGVYAFAKSLEELVEKIKAKQRILEAQEEIVKEVLRAGGSLE